MILRSHWLARRLLFCVSAAIAVHCLPGPLAGAERAPTPTKPQRVKVSAEAAQVKDGSKVIATVRKGQQFDVQRVNGSWYAIEVTIGGQKKSGWVAKSDLTLVNDTPPAAQPAAKDWQQLAPQGGRFSVSLPGTPKLKRQSTGGVDVSVYTSRSGAVTYIAGFLDIPTGRALTLDAAVNSAASQLKGKLLSHTRYSLSGYSGREFTIQEPDKTVTRQRILMVKQRLYQIGVEGPASMVDSSDAAQFFDSFRLTK